MQTTTAHRLDDTDKNVLLILADRPSTATETQTILRNLGLKIPFHFYAIISSIQKLLKVGWLEESEGKYQVPPKQVSDLEQILRGML